MTTVTAAQRRGLLANAHAKWFATADKDEAKEALRKVLVDMNYVESTDRITVRLDCTSIEVLVDADDFLEVLAIDAYGNIMKGTE